MRIMIFFDLPTITSKQRKAYRKFRKDLILNGYIMMQESVYSKLLTNYGMCKLEIKRLEQIKPKEGLIQCLEITEKQYAEIINICGEIKHAEIDSMERMIVI